MTAWEKLKHGGVVAPGTRGAAWKRLGAAAISRWDANLANSAANLCNCNGPQPCLAICHPRARMARLLLGVAASL